MNSHKRVKFYLDKKVTIACNITKESAGSLWLLCGCVLVRSGGSSRQGNKRLEEGGKVTSLAWFLPFTSKSYNLLISCPCLWSCCPLWECSYPYHLSSPPSVDPFFTTHCLLQETWADRSGAFGLPKYSKHWSLIFSYWVTITNFIYSFIRIWSYWR